MAESILSFCDALLQRAVAPGEVLLKLGGVGAELYQATV